MTTNEKLAPEDQHDYLSWDRGRKRGKMMIGVFIALLGFLFLMREIGFHVPRWVFHPSSFLIAIGIIVLVRHKFEKLTGYILILIGLTLKLHGFFPDLINLRLLFPIGLILIGLGMVYRSKFGKERQEKKWEKMKKQASSFGMSEEQVSPDDFVDAISIFGSVKKQVTTKSFLGADIFTLFGGTELNLTQADFESRAVIDMTTIFGGAEIIIPANWQVKSEMVSIFGGMEDNRYQRLSDDGPEKVLILKGTCVFGGVEIKSYSA